MIKHVPPAVMFYFSAICMILSVRDSPVKATPFGTSKPFKATKDPQPPHRNCSATSVFAVAPSPPWAAHTGFDRELP